MQSIITSAFQMQATVLLGPNQFWVDPAAFGAKMDGQTNDTAALTTALNYAQSNGGGLALKSPIVVGSSFEFPVNTQLAFTGSGRVIAGANVTINSPVIAVPGQFIFDSSQGGTFLGGQNLQFLFPSWFNALADGVDCTAALNLMYRFAFLAGCIPCYYGSGVYTISGTVFPNGSASPPTSEGPSSYGTENGNVGSIIDCTAVPVGTPAFYVRGGSGGTTSMSIERLMFNGNAGDKTPTGGTWGIQSQGMSGFKARRCFFQHLGYAMLMNNSDSGSFTEFNTMEDCVVNSTVATALRMHRASGNPSFHGSGIKGDTIINLSPLGYPAVQIDVNCQVYNSPMEFEAFSTMLAGTVGPLGTGVQALINCDATQTPTFKRLAIGVEIQQSGTVQAGSGAIIAAPGGTLMGLGITNSTGANFTAGTLVRCDTATLHPDGSLAMQGMKRTSLFNLTTGSTVITVGTIHLVHRLVYLQIRATGYNFYALLDVDFPGTGAVGTVTTLSSSLFVNTANYGAPTFTVDANGNLTVTNPNYPSSGVSCYMTDHQISGGQPLGSHQQI